MLERKRYEDSTYSRILYSNTGNGDRGAANGDLHVSFLFYRS